MSCRLLLYHQLFISSLPIPEGWTNFPCGLSPKYFVSSKVNDFIVEKSEISTECHLYLRIESQLDSGHKV